MTAGGDIGLRSSNSPSVEEENQEVASVVGFVFIGCIRARIDAGNNPGCWLTWLRAVILPDRRRSWSWNTGGHGSGTFQGSVEPARYSIWSVLCCVAN